MYRMSFGDSSFEEDQRFMKMAVQVSLKHSGRCGENPSVGCVVVKEGHVLGIGVTGIGGVPHAEVVACTGVPVDLLEGATVYVTLEPCAHEGKTSSCARFLVRCKVARVVFGVEDPDLRVSGKGKAILLEAGILVDFGVCADLCSFIHRAFILNKKEGRPLVVLKSAMSLDSKIGHTGMRWITCKESIQLGHHLRLTADGICVGVGTLNQDNPLLTCRLSNSLHVAEQPIRIIFDPSLRCDENAQILKSGNEGSPVWVLTASENRHKIAMMRERGVGVFSFSVSSDCVETVFSFLNSLAQLGINRLVIEAGEKLGTLLLRSGLVDDLYIFRSPILLGSGATSFFSDDFILSDSFVTISQRRVGSDILEYYRGSRWKGLSAMDWMFC